MSSLRGSSWGPRPLPELLAGQLGERGLGPADAPECARRIAAGAAAGDVASNFVDLGACKYLEGDIDGAVAAWRHAVSSGADPAASRALLNLGLTYEHLHLHARALGLLGTVEQRGVEPYAPLGSMAKARCERAIGRSDEAMETMARLAQATMSNRPKAATLPETLLGLGELAIEAGRADRAERAWRAAALGADSAARTAAIDHLVHLLRQQGHDDEIVALLAGSAVDRAEGHASDVLDRAATLVRLGRDEQAMSLATSITAGELAAHDRFRLAELRIELGLVNEAIDELEVLLNSPSHDVGQRAAFALGEVYRTYDMADAALSMYERARSGTDPYWTSKAEASLRSLTGVDAVDEIEVAAAAQAVESGVVVDAAAEASAAGSGVVVDAAAAGAVESGVVVDAAADASAAGSGFVSDAAASPVVESGDEPGVSISGAAATEASDAPPVSGHRPGRSDGSSNGVPVAFEPVVVVLSELEDDDAADLDINPYAALAPEDHDHRDIAPSIRNPYAELAPNFTGPDAGPLEDVEPGDWQSMLDDWNEPALDPEAPPRRSRAFSRYT